MSRRSAPRNDRQKHVAVRVGNYAFPGEIRHAFRICPKDCFSVLYYRKENGLPRRSAPRNHHVFSHHDKRKCDILEVWQKFDVI